MAKNTTRMQWPYPDEDQDPWFDIFESLMVQMDASGYAAREDRHLIVASTALFSFDAGSGVVTWTAAVELVNAITGHILTLPAGTVTLADGQYAFLVLTRGLLTNQTVSLTVASTVPNTNDALAFCLRRGTSVYFIRGAKINDGESSSLFGGNTEGYGAVGSIITSAGTIAPTKSIHHISGTVTITTITPPSASFTGTIRLITNSSLSFGGGGNIAASGQITTAAGQIYSASFDGTSWYIK